jgi:hypothetical protein
MYENIRYPFEDFSFSFRVSGNPDIDIKIFLDFYSRGLGLIFCITKNKILIYNFSETKRFFGLSNSLDDFSEIQIPGFRSHPFKAFDKLTGYKLTDKLKEFIIVTKLEEQTDIFCQKLYETLELLFPEQDSSVQLIFVD